jgi:hypothetical protein
MDVSTTSQLSSPKPDLSITVRLVSLGSDRAVQKSPGASAPGVSVCIAFHRVGLGETPQREWLRAGADTECWGNRLLTRNARHYSWRGYGNTRISVGTVVIPGSRIQETR